MTPEEALHYAIACCTLYTSRLRNSKPGSLIEPLRPEAREALKQLTSEQAYKSFPPFLFPDEKMQQVEIQSNDRLSFDRNILRIRERHYREKKYEK